MHCYECGTTSPSGSRPATAVCTRCGAATCADHTHEVTTEIPTSSVGNRVVRSERRLRCPACVGPAGAAG